MFLVPQLEKSQLMLLWTLSFMYIKGYTYKISLHIFLLNPKMPKKPSAKMCDF